MLFFFENSKKTVHSKLRFSAKTTLFPISYFEKYVQKNIVGLTKEAKVQSISHVECVSRTSPEQKSKTEPILI